jgi:phosphate transport system protein
MATSSNVGYPHPVRLRSAGGRCLNGVGRWYIWPRMEGETPLRVQFHQSLAAIDTRVVQLFALVCESISAATECLLAGDCDVAQEITGRDALVDELELELEELAEIQLLTQSPMVGDMRFLVTVLRIVPQLERCADLAEHVAHRATTGLATRVTPELRVLLDDMGTRCVAMWQEVVRAWSERDESAAAQLDVADDELDLLHDQLTASLAVSDIARADLMQATLVGRFYERLGDHAVHIAERIPYITSGRHRRPG